VSEGQSKPKPENIPKAIAHLEAGWPLDDDQRRDVIEWLSDRELWREQSQREWHSLTRTVLVERVARAIYESIWADEFNDMPGSAEHAQYMQAARDAIEATGLESAQAEIARLTAILGNHDDLPEQLLRDADEMEACGAGNEAANMRKLVARLLEARAALKGNQP
jgi:hypothetical protein